MAKRPTQIDRGIADIDAKIALVKAEQDKRIEHFKLTLETMAACRALLVAMKVERKPKSDRKPRIVVPKDAA